LQPWRASGSGGPDAASLSLDVAVVRPGRKGRDASIQPYEKEGWGGLRPKAPPLPAGKAQQKPDRAAGHPSSASSLESRRGGGRRCFAASSIAAKMRPPFLQTPPLPAADCPPLRGFCASRQRRLRNPPVPLAVDIAPFRALTTWPPSTWA
jgi:hypothetical protein